MNTFDYTVIAAALSGLIMVVGGIVLIYKGAMVLAATDSGSALTIEWKKNFRLSTQAPGIAFFIVGLIFSSLAIYAAKPNTIESIKIEGEIVKIAEPVTIRARSTTWTLDGGTNGIVKGRIHPHVEDIVLEISAPGYKPETITISIGDLVDRTVRFEAIELEQKVPAVVSNIENIVKTTEPVAPITQAPSYGGAR